MRCSTVGSGISLASCDNMLALLMYSRDGVPPWRCFASSRRSRSFSAVSSASLRYISHPTYKPAGGFPFPPVGPDNRNGLLSPWIIAYVYCGSGRVRLSMACPTRQEIHISNRCSSLRKGRLTGACSAGFRRPLRERVYLP